MADWVFAQLWEEQDGECPVCHELLPVPAVGKRRMTVVDHAPPEVVAYQNHPLANRIFK